MAMIHGGKMIIKLLQKEGVKYVFSLAGGHINPIYDASIDSGIKIIDTRHEQAAAHMAEAWARLTGRPGVCLVTAGPGFTDAITGITNAWMANAPLIFISGRAGIGEMERLSLQEMEHIDLIKPVTKWSRVIYQAERIAEYLAIAFRQATTGRPGPVFLDIPIDVLGKKVDESEVVFPTHYRTEASPAGDPEMVQKAAELLKSANKPVVIAGSGAFYSGAGDALQEFAELTRIPVFTSTAARGVLPDDHPVCLGPGNMMAPGAAGTAIPGADVLLLLGHRISLYLLFGRPPVIGPETKIIQVDIEGEEIGRNRGIELGIVGDVRQVLRQLIHELKGHSFSGAWLDELRGVHRAQREAAEVDIKSDQVPIHPLRLAGEVNAFLDRDATVAADGGDTQIWISMVKEVFYPGHYLDTGLFGCLGVGIPFALTAKLLRPDKQVLLFMGDGAAGLNLMEFDTAARHKLPIVMVINNDQAWGMIKHGQEMVYGEDRLVGSELGIVHYEKVVEALGGYGEFIERPEEIAPALKRAFDSNLPACINVLTDQKAISPGSYALASLGTG